MEQNQKNKKMLLTIIGLFALLIAVTGATYAYFSIVVSGNEGANSINVNAALMGDVIFTDGDEINAANIYPGWHDAKTFTVANTTAGANALIDFAIYLDISTNTLSAASDGAFVHEITSSTTTNNGTLAQLNNTPVPSDKKIIANGTLNGVDTHTYEYKIEFKETGLNQNAAQGKTFAGKLGVVICTSNMRTWDAQNNTWKPYETSDSEKSEFCKVKTPTIVATVFSSLILDESGNLFCFGSGELCSMTNEEILLAQIKEGTTFKTISAGYRHALAIDADGNLWAWGENYRKELGTGESQNVQSIPAQVLPGHKFISASAGQQYSLAIDTNGDIWTWGLTYSEPSGAIPAKISSGTNFLTVSAGYDHALAIDEDGNLWSWGKNTAGQLGNGDTVDNHTPTKIETEIKFKKISAGSSHSLAIDTNGNLWAWGLNEYGEIGNGTTDNQLTPLQIKAGTKFKEISANNSFHSLAIDIDGNLWGWGCNEDSQIVSDTTDNQLSPVLIEPGRKFSSASADYFYTVAIDETANFLFMGYPIGTIPTSLR